MKTLRNLSRDMLARTGSLLVLPLAAMSALAAAGLPDASNVERADLDIQGQRIATAMPTRAAEARTDVPRGTQPASWTVLGPPGGDVSDVAASPTDGDIVIAALSLASGGGGAYRSADGGATWTRVPALDGLASYHVEFAPDGTAYLGTQDGVWISEDDGVSWTSANLGIGLNDHVLSVAVDPQDPETLWIGIAEAFGQQPINLMRSTDGGATWVNRTPPLTVPMNGNAIAIDPDDSNTVIAAFAGDFAGGAAWVTTDGGATWTERTAGLPANPMRAVHYDGDRLLLGGGQLFGSQFVGLYASDDLGATWTALHDASWPLRVVTGIAVDPSDSEVILVSTDGTGVHRSEDGGSSWTIGTGDSGNLAAQSVRFVPGSTSGILLGVSSLAVYRSDDGGANFEQSAAGISELSLFSIHANPLDPQEIAVAFQGNNNGGVLVSSDAGTTWEAAAVPPTRYRVVRFAPDGTLYALSTGPTSIAPEGLYRRDDDGVWSSIGPDQGPLFESDLSSVRISDEDPERIWLGGADFGVAGNEQTIWFTGDGGASWTKQYEGPGSLVTTDIEIVDDGTDQRLVAVFDDVSGGNTGGALRTVDGGATWTPASAGLSGFIRLPKLCRSAAAPDTLFMSAWTGWGSGGVFRTGDAAIGGWTATSWAGPTINDIVCDGENADVLFLAQSGTPRVVRSEDAGQTFTAFDDGLQDAGEPRELTQLPGPMGGLYLATSRGSFRNGGDDNDTIFADGFEAGN